MGRMEKIGSLATRSISIQGVDNFCHIASEALRRAELKSNVPIPYPDQEATWIPTASADIPGYGYLLMVLSKRLPETVKAPLTRLAMRMMQAVSDPALRPTFSTVGKKLKRIHSLYLQHQQSQVAPIQSLLEPTAEQSIQFSDVSTMSGKTDQPEERVDTSLGVIQAVDRGEDPPHYFSFCKAMGITMGGRSKTAWDAIPTLGGVPAQQKMVEHDDVMFLPPVTLPFFAPAFNRKDLVEKTQPVFLFS